MNNLLTWLALDLYKISPRTVDLWGESILIPAAGALSYLSWSRSLRTCSLIKDLGRNESASESASASSQADFIQMSMSPYIRLLLLHYILLKNMLYFKYLAFFCSFSLFLWRARASAGGAFFTEVTSVYISWWGGNENNPHGNTHCSKQMHFNMRSNIPPVVSNELQSFLKAIG